MNWSTVVWSMVAAVCLTLAALHLLVWCRQRAARGNLLFSLSAVETFSGGGEFLASLTAHRPDCAVLDLHMPDMTGFDVLKRLAEMSAGVPVVVMTGHDSPDAEECAIRDGAAAYLHKPINDRLLLDTIAAAIARSAANPPPDP